MDNKWYIKIFETQAKAVWKIVKKLMEFHVDPRKTWQIMKEVVGKSNLINTNLPRKGAVYNTEILMKKNYKRFQ